MSPLLNLMLVGTSLVPHFSEKHVEKYYFHFEVVAPTLVWPKDVWTLLLQCALTGTGGH